MAGGAAGLRRFAVGAVRSGTAGYEAGTCELCGAGVESEHGHVVNLETRRLLCACVPCSLLFTQPGAGLGNAPRSRPARGRLRSVPDRWVAVALTVAEWDALQVPVGMAFFFLNSVLGRVVAQYPSPAGATESLLELGAWSAVVSSSDVLGSMEPDVEALIVHHGRDARVEAYLVPVDACYELVGRLRLHWTGFDGGPEARQDIADFLTRARARSRHG